MSKDTNTTPWLKKFSYLGSPVLESFADDNTFIRGIRGPIGSGKSSGCCVEIYRRACQQEAGKDGVARSRWAVVRGCFDDETEILTEKRGWVLFKDLLPGDKVASLIEGKELVFVTPTQYFIYPYDGEMVGFENEGLDFCVTPEHNMYVDKRRTRKKLWDNQYGFMRADDVFESHYGLRMKRNADVWTGVNPKGYSPDMFEWLGFWFAEGCAHVKQGQNKVGASHHNFVDGLHYSCVITQVKEEGIEYTRNLFEEAGLRFYESRTELCQRYNPSIKYTRVNFRLNVDSDEVKQLIVDLSQCGKAIDKRLPEWIKSAPREHLIRFIDGFIAGDGYIASGTSMRVACTSSKQLADDLQEIALKAGLVGNITQEDTSLRRGAFKCNTPYLYKITFISLAKYQPVLQVQGYANKYRGFYKKKYDGNVYCVEVPSHVVYVRRNNKAYWCSQSYRKLKSTTIKTWLEWFPEEIFGDIKWDSPITHRILTQIPETGKKIDLEVMFFPLETPQDMDNVMSLELTGIWINEARELPTISMIDDMTGRVNRYPSMTDKPDHIPRENWPTWTGLIMDTNPPDSDHWWYKLFEEELILKPDLNVRQFVQPSAINGEGENLRNLNPKYYQNIIMGKSQQWVDVYVHNKYGYSRDGKPVYPDYKDELHLATEEILPNKYLPLVIGMDFGLNCSAAICQVDVRGRFFILEELSSDMGIRQFIEVLLKPLLKTKYSGISVRVIGDPAGMARSSTDEKTCYDELRAAGITAEPASTNSPVARIGAVTTLLTRLTDGKPAFKLNPQCKTLRRAFNGKYKFRRVQRTGGYIDTTVPDKNEYSHLSDAVQYAALYAEGEVSERTKPKLVVKKPPKGAFI